MTAHVSPIAIGLLLAKSSLLLGFGWCVSRLLHRASASVRHLVWLTVIVGVLVIPVVGELAPVPFRVLPAEPLPQLTAAGSLLTGSAAGPRLLTNASASAPRADVPVSTTPSRRTFDVGLALIATWLVVTLLLLLRFAIGMISVARLARRSVSLATTEWTPLLAEAARRLNVAPLPRLVMSDRVEMAFAFGAVSPVLIVPGSAREWSNDRRRAVLLHELAHIQRRDLASHAIAGIVCAINWFNPFIWIAARQLRVESEMASDEIVLRAGVRPSVYAQHLLDMVTSFGRRTPSVALAMARPKEFEGRLVAILDPERQRPLLAGRRGAVVALAALPAFAIGAVAPVPRVAAVVARPLAASPATTEHLDSRVTEMTPAPRVTPAARRVPRAVLPAAPSSSIALSRDAVTMLLRFGTGGIVNPMMMILRDADSLNLTGPQADSIATLNRRYMIQLSRIWAPVSSFYVSRSEPSAPLLPPPGADPTRATIQALAAIVRDADGVLTPEQRGKLAANIAPYLDPHALTALSGAPNGVFLSLDQLFSVRGRGRGGG